MRTDPKAPARRRGWQRMDWEWEGRAEIAREYLGEATSMIDIGRGMITVKRLLPGSVRYQGVDIVRRDETTIVLDLNEERLPPLDFDAANVMRVTEHGAARQCATNSVRPSI